MPATIQLGIPGPCGPQFPHVQKGQSQCVDLEGAGTLSVSVWVGCMCVAVCVSVCDTLRGSAVKHRVLKCALYLVCLCTVSSGAFINIYPCCHSDISWEVRTGAGRGGVRGELTGGESSREPQTSSGCRGSRGLAPRRGAAA